LSNNLDTQVDEKADLDGKNAQWEPWAHAAKCAIPYLEVNTCSFTTVIQYV